MIEPSPSQPAEFCHHLDNALQKTADGTAGWPTRTYVRLHTATCAGCRSHLHGLEADVNAGTIPVSRH